MIRLEDLDPEERAEVCAARKLARGYRARWTPTQKLVLGLGLRKT